MRQQLGTVGRLLNWVGVQIGASTFREQIGNV